MDKIQLFAGAAIIVSGLGFALPFAIQPMAEKDKLLTTCPPNSGKVIVKGGDFSDIILNFEGYHLNAPGRPGYNPDISEWEIVKNEPGVNYEYRKLPIREAGAYWVGFLRKVHEYPLNWMERNQHQTPENPDRYVLRDDLTKIFKPGDFTYYFETEEVETEELVLAKMFYAITVRINNPRKAILMTDSWLVQVETLADRIGRDYIGNHKFAELRTETKDKDTDSPVAREFQDYFSSTLLAFNNSPVSPEGPEGTKDRWGVTLVNAQVLDISLVGETAKESQKAAGKLFIAEVTGQADLRTAEYGARVTRVTAEAQAAATVVLAAAKKEELAALASQPELAKTQIIADALKGSGKTIIAAANGNLVDAFASLAKPTKE